MNRPASAEGRLAEQLREAVAGEVRFDAGSRAQYSTDASNYRQVPIGVVVPRTVDDVVAAVAVCRANDVPVLNRGGGTSLAGQTTNQAVVIDCSKHLRGIVSLDPEARTATVEPGVVLDQLRGQAERHHLTFGPDPSTHSRCTLGGMIGNNSCGVHSVMAGKTVENVEALEVLTYDGLRLWVGATPDHELDRRCADPGRVGEVYRGMRALRDRYAGLIRERFPDIPRRVSGFNLDQLLPEHGFHVARALVGTEGTCVTVLHATVRLVDSPPARSLVVLGYPDIYRAADHVPDLLQYGPIGLEGLDEVLVEDMRRKHLRPSEVALLPDGEGWLMVEFGGENKEESDAAATRMMDALKRSDVVPSMKLFDDPPAERKLWEVRESGLGATARVPGEPDTWPGWEDSAVPVDRLGEYLRQLQKLYDKYGLKAALYGHFGQACVHTRINFDLVTAAGIARFRGFMEEAADLCVSMGGSLSGEHGDGQARAELLPKMYGPELVRAFEEFKGLWDPAGRMNPGKVVRPRRMDEDLRLGTRYNPIKVATTFQFPKDDGSFARGVLRCVGVGKCRRTDPEGGVMCPSYQVTLEEEHSTRGRARLLFEMLNGAELGGPWRNEHVKDALDLCLACKGCKGDCPVNVDMATYKAEFLSHYYQGRLRPASAYSMGLIMYAARVGSRVPGLANGAVALPGVKRLAGVDQRRSVPRFASPSLRAWWARRPNGGGPPAGRAGDVILWPDTFTNAFHPAAGQAAVRVLEAAGFRVRLPGRWLCCGRPLYDFGMLGLAKRRLGQVLRVLKDDIETGTPIVGLEPSCVSVFRDELIELFPDDADAVRLRQQVMLLSEFLEQRAPDFDLPRIGGRALVQGHCHHKSVLDFDSERRVLDRLGVAADVLDSGCCGMAGSFGFEAGEHYDVSVACAERALVPAVRGTPDSVRVVADGFSCREQIAQLTGRRAVHLAEVIAEGLA